MFLICSGRLTLSPSSLPMKNILPFDDHRLEPPGDSRGASCDAQGLSLGPIRLLADTPAGFAPRAIGDLDAVLSSVFERPFDSRGLTAGLQTAAKALNDGDLARAMVATLHLRLPVLTETQMRRARMLAASPPMAKASPDDPEHPGWPAGAPGDLGGKFGPRTVEPGMAPERSSAGRCAWVAGGRFASSRGAC